MSGLLAVRGSRVGQIENGHRTDVLGELPGNNPLITKGLRAMLTKRTKCERSKSYALVQIIRSAQGVRLEVMVSVKGVGEDDISDEQSLRGKSI